jgi:hypothetical protein
MALPALAYVDVGGRIPVKYLFRHPQEIGLEVLP